MTRRTLGSILLGGTITLIVHGYQFGQSNHSVYLIDGLRKTDPTLLANDWFSTQTLQYHSTFGAVCALFLKLGVIAPAFVAIYAAMILALHAAWLTIVRSIGGDERAYLAGVVLYSLSAGGLGLGSYQFLQDSAVLASNIANVALLVGVAMVIRQRLVAAGLALAIAGLFHLNHAVVVCLFWAAFATFENRASLAKWLDRRFVTASVLIAAGCLANIIPAAIAKLHHPRTMPVADFVDIYVRLRHPHHYDPSSWPFALWLAFCFCIPPAAYFVFRFLRFDRQPATRRTLFVLVFFLALQIVALLFAGATYRSETLVQMSLYRFSIVPHLLFVSFTGCLITRCKWAMWALPFCLAVALAVVMFSPVAEVARARLGSIAAVVILAAAPAVWPILVRRRLELGVGLFAVVLTLASWSHVAGLTRPLISLDRDYLALCEWTVANTPREAIFLVPPAEESFRLRARRAIVVNWKSPPQLAGELPEWVERLSANLAWDNVNRLPRGSYIAAIAAMNKRYDELNADQLFSAAREYDARFVVATHDLGEDFAARRVGPAFGRYLLYDAAR